MKYGACEYDLRYAGLVDMGRTRTSNQDEVILCPEQGFFAVSDGMGGLRDGGKTSAMIKQVLPEMIREAQAEWSARGTPEFAQELLKNSAALLSDSIYEAGNEGRSIEYGATLCGVWLVGRQAVVVNIGDSRAYWYQRRLNTFSQITKDHNIAALLVESGDLTREEAKHHHTSSRITRFMGMPRPALPDTFLLEPDAGDCLLFCSDGLHGMLEDEQIKSILQKYGDAEAACRALIDAANEAGGQDNISAVVVRLRKPSLTDTAMTAVRKVSAAFRLNPKSENDKIEN